MPLTLTRDELLASIVAERDRVAAHADALRALTRGMPRIPLVRIVVNDRVIAQALRRIDALDSYHRWLTDLADKLVRKLAPTCLLEPEHLNAERCTRRAAARAGKPAVHDERP